MSKRCVVTGLGLVCAVGDSVDQCWKNVLDGVSGIKKVTTVNTDNCYASMGAESALSDGGLSDERLDRSSLLCIKAAKEAINDSALKLENEDKNRIGVISGSCVGGVLSVEKYYNDQKNGNEDKSDIFKMPAAAIANNVACHFGLGGETANIVNACAAGTISISYACDLIRKGDADVFLAGGSDAFTTLAFGGFHALHALDEDPCSPFNKSKGITLGEGAGILVVESYEHAVARGARIYCEILGSGVSSDAHHITAPRPDGQGQMSAIRRAMENSGVSPSEIDYINAHGTGTAKNDEAEFLSIHTLFDGKNDKLSVSSTKSMTGHCLGAAGSIEAVFTVKAVCENIAPPTIGYDKDDIQKLGDKAGKIDFIPNEKREKNIGFAMSNSFAFGGNNASIIFSKNPHDIPDKREEKRIFVTGLGKVISSADETESVTAPIGAEDYNELGIKMAFYRKLDRFSQLQLVSGMRALKNAGIAIDETNENDIGIIIGTSDGPATEIIGFQKNLLEGGTAAGSAFSFPNTVVNAAGGYLSIFAGIKGYNVTVANSFQAGLQSVCYACDVLKNSEEKIMLAAGTDENTETTQSLYNKLGLLKNAKPYEDKNGFVLGEGSVTAVIETEESVKARGAEVLAEIIGYATAHTAVSYETVRGTQDAMKRAILSACENSGTAVNEIKTVCGFANGLESFDSLEKSVLSELMPQASVISTKKLTGEARAASATMNLAYAAELLSANADEKIDGDKILCVSVGTGGSYSAVILRRKD